MVGDLVHLAADVVPGGLDPGDSADDAGVASKVVVELLPDVVDAGVAEQLLVDGLEDDLDRLDLDLVLD